MSTKNFEFQFPNRFDFDSTELEFHVESGITSVRQFKTAKGKNILRSIVPEMDNPEVPEHIATRLTDGNPDTIFKFKDTTSFKFDLSQQTDLREIVVKHEVGTQPNDVVIATSVDGNILDIHWSNDKDDSLGLGHEGTDNLFVADKNGLRVTLDCHRAKFVHIFTNGFISTSSNPSSDETSISEIEVYECVYSNDKPNLATKETVRLTDFEDIIIDSTENEHDFLMWNPIVNGIKYWYDGRDWITVDDNNQWNKTDELLANISSFFILPTVYDLQFSVNFVSELGDGTAVLTKLFVDFDNGAINKADTTRVFGQIIDKSGRPRTDVYVTATLEIGGKADAAVEQEGAKGRIIFDDEIQHQPIEADKVDDQGIFSRDLVPNTVLSEPRTQYVFTFWKKHPHNTKNFMPIYSVSDVIPKATKHNLATQTIA